MTHSRTQVHYFVPHYTLLLGLLGLTQFLLPLANKFYELRLFDGTPLFASVASYVAWVLLAFFFLGTAWARHLSAASAHGFTVVASVVAVIMWPVGTAMFIYWVGWIRKRERPN